MTAARWTAAIAVSALVHAGGYGALALAVKPDPVQDQPLPPSQLDVQAYQLDRTEAQQARPDTQAAPEAQAQGVAVAAGAIPQSQARPAQPQAEPLAPGTAKAEPVQADTAQPPQLSAAPPPSAALTAAQPASAALALAQPRATEAAPALAMAQPVTAAAAPASALTAAQPQTAPLSTAAPSATLLASLDAPAASLPQIADTAIPIAAAVQPAAPLPQAASQAAPVPQAAAPAEQLALAQPDAAALPDTAPPTQPIAQAASNATPTPAAAPQAQSVKATFAFPGSSDPVSLAAFQSFMQPGDTAQGDPLRDGLSALLSQVPCSRLQVAFDPDTATLQLNGHIPEAGLAAPVLAALQSQMGGDIRVSEDIRILPRPQCGALSGIADVGLPQSNDQSTNPLLIGEASQARNLDFVKDQRLWFDLTAPEYDAYVYVDYFDADGNVIHLAPNDQVPLTVSPRDTSLTVGTRLDTDTGLKIVIGPPYGQEIAVAFAASERLYDDERPLVEPAARYLDFLKARVAAKRAEHPDFKGEWVYFFVTTKER